MRSRFILEPPPGFRGLDPHAEIERYERNLPHWRQEGATYFVTFRMADSLPQSKLDELKSLQLEFERKLEEREQEDPKLSRSEREKLWNEYAKISQSKTEAWLDRGMGACLLREPENREIARAALLFFHDKRYEMGAFVVMPNHVHALIRPFAEFSLEDILRSTKRKISRTVNAQRGKSGPLWQQESFDRIVRDAEHLWRCLQYIGNNPRQADLANDAGMLWISEAWQENGWDFVAE